MKFVILTIGESAREFYAVVPEYGHLHLDRGFFISVSHQYYSITMGYNYKSIMVTSSIEYTLISEAD